MTSAARYAFFDVDDTLIRTKSMFSFFRHWCVDWINDAEHLEQFERHFAAARANGVPRETMNSDYYRYLAGVEPQQLAAAGRKWARTIIDGGLFYPAPVAELQRLMRQGVVPVFVSGSFDAVLEPIARHLGVQQILATRMEISCDGLYSGEIGTPQTIGAGKAKAIGQFLGDHGGSSVNCWAFGDDISDLPMLECVGHPVAVGSNPKLVEIARFRNWPILDTVE